MAGSKVVILTDATFHSEVLQAQIPVLVDFWAPWCGPCRAVAPIIDALAREYAGRVKVAQLNIDGSPGIARSYQIRSIPTVVVFQGGRIVRRLVGAVPKPQLAAMLDSVLGSAEPTLAAG